MNDITKSLDYIRTLQKQEKAQENSDLWAAILAIVDALEAANITVPEIHAQKAQESLLRADVIGSGDLSDTQLAAVATVGNARTWSADMGQIFKNEPVIASDGSTYICTQAHLAQAGWAPGTEGGRTLFRLIRSEPETGYLDFAWGEHVPYGSVRRDPTDNKLVVPPQRHLAPSPCPSSKRSLYKASEANDRQKRLAMTSSRATTNQTITFSRKWLLY